MNNDSYSVGSDTTAAGECSSNFRLGRGPSLVVFSSLSERPQPEMTHSGKEDPRWANVVRHYACLLSS